MSPPILTSFATIVLTLAAVVVLSRQCRKPGWGGNIIGLYQEPSPG